MLNRKNLMYNLCFWGVMLLAITAERWMDLICGVIF